MLLVPSCSVDILFTVTLVAFASLPAACFERPFLMVSVGVGVEQNLRHAFTLIRTLLMVAQRAVRASRSADYLNQRSNTPFVCAA